MSQAPTGTYRQLAVGDGHACAIHLADTIVCWGDDGYGPTQVP